MNKLYQLPLYKKFHWYIADILMLAIVCISVAVGGIKMLSPYNILYIGAALFMIQMALIIICEKDSKKRKDQYLIGIEVFVIPVVILFLAMGMKY